MTVFYDYVIVSYIYCNDIISSSSYPASLSMSSAKPTLLIAVPTNNNVTSTVL